MKIKTNPLQHLLLLLVLAVSSASVLSQNNEAAEKDKAALQGAWKMVSGERASQPLPKESLKDYKRVCQGDETTVTRQGQLILKAKFALDPSKRPAQINYTVTGGPYAGTTQLGIYELDGDKVKFCFAVAGKERPADFSTKAGDGRTITVWKPDAK